MIVDKIKKRENKALINKKANIDIPVGKWVKCEKKQLEKITIFVLIVVIILECILIEG